MKATKGWRRERERVWRTRSRVRWWCQGGVGGSEGMVVVVVEGLGAMSGTKRDFDVEVDFTMGSWSDNCGGKGCCRRIASLF